MSIWTIGTRAAILVLTVGSLAVFAWFLRDAIRMMRRRWSGRGDDGSGPIA